MLVASRVVLASQAMLEPRVLLDLKEPQAILDHKDHKDHKVK